MAIAANASVSRADIASSTATVTITKPAGTASTDVLIVTFGTDRGSAVTGAITPPSGWTRVGASSGDVVNSLSHVRLDVFWALGSVANLGFTNAVSGSSQQQGWACVGFTGVDNTTPVDVAGTVVSSNSATTATAGAITVATDQAWELIGFASWNGGTDSATGYTVIQNVASPPATNADAALFYNTTPKGTGATATVVCTSSGSTASQIVVVLPFALRPATAAASQVPWDVPHSPQHQAVMAA